MPMPSSTGRAGSPAKPASATARTSATRFRPREAARHGAEATAYNRSQVLYFLAENLSARAAEFAARLSELAGASAKEARAEVDLSIERLFYYAGMADKFEGRVHQPPARAVTLALHEPVGVIGIVTGDAAPLLGLVSLIAPALAMGNCVVAVPSQRYPLLATDLYQVIEYSDVPAGAINIVTGKTAELAGVLAKHDDVDGLWLVADPRHLRESRGGLDRQPQAHVDQQRPLDRLVFARGSRRVLPAPRRRGEERLGALRRLRAAGSIACTVRVARRRAGRCNPRAGTSDTCARRPDNCR